MGFYIGYIDIVTRFINNYKLINDDKLISKIKSIIEKTAKSIDEGSLEEIKKNYKILVSNLKLFTKKMNQL